MGYESPTAWLYSAAGDLVLVSVIQNNYEQDGSAAYSKDGQHEAQHTYYLYDRKRNRSAQIWIGGYVDFSSYEMNFSGGIYQLSMRAESGTRVYYTFKIDDSRS